MLLSAGIKKFAVCEALIPGQVSQDDPLWEFLDPAFRTEVGDFFTVRNRKTISQSFRRPIVIKEIRLQFNLEGVHQRFGIPILHIRRHPAGMITSFMQSKWSWTFSDFSLSDILPTAIARELAEFDSDAISRMSAYWAITERFVESSTKGKSWARVVSYEEMVADPAATITSLCSFIGHEQQTVPNFNLPSISTIDFSKRFNSEAQARGWQSTLDKSDIERIEYVVGKIFPEYSF